MDQAFVSAFAALAGSIVGGLTAGATTWLSHRSQARTARRMHTVTHREDLYRDFIVAASEVFGKAVTSSEPQVAELVILYGMISRMRVLSSPEVVVAAETTIAALLEAFAAPNKTVYEVQLLIHNDKTMDPLQRFSQVARKELNAL